MTSDSLIVSRGDVARYYDYTLPFYRLFWHGKTRAIHYGIWDTHTRTHTEALLNSNRLLAQAVHITQADTVLDVGCGVGGSALWLARETGAHVIGITLSSRQVTKAVQLARRAGFTDQTSFFVRNYLDTQFADRSFSVVWGLESLCYAHDRVDALATELYRVLRPDGRLVIADGFLGKNGALLPAEQKLVHMFEEGFVLPHLITVHAFVNALVVAGFRNVEVTDVTAGVLPTARRMRLVCLLTYPFTRFFTALGLLPPLMLKNHMTGLIQQELFESRALEYCIVTAKK